MSLNYLICLKNVNVMTLMCRYSQATIIHHHFLSLAIPCYHLPSLLSFSVILYRSLFLATIHHSTLLFAILAIIHHSLLLFTIVTIIHHSLLSFTIVTIIHHSLLSFAITCCHSLLPITIPFNLSPFLAIIYHPLLS